MSQDLTTKPNRAVPDYLKGKKPEAALGNLGAEDLIPPRFQIVHATSPLCAQFPGRAIPGQFWNPMTEESWGAELTGTPVYPHKSYVLWAPRGMDVQGPLARAADGIHWDKPNTKFEVVFPRNATKYIWDTKGSVAESGLDRFGSSQPDVDRAPPAAALTYDMMWLIDPPEGGMPTLGLITNSKSGVKAFQKLHGLIKTMGVDLYYQRYRIKVVRRAGPTGESYFGFDYEFDGFASEEIGAMGRNLWESWHGKDLGVAEPADETQRDPDRDYSKPNQRDDIEIPF